MVWHTSYEEVDRVRSRCSRACSAQRRNKHAGCARTSSARRRTPARAARRTARCRRRSTIPATTFRSAYQDPGGMWMPSQMTLPQHVDELPEDGRQARRQDARRSARRIRSPASCRPVAARRRSCRPTGLIVTNHHCVQGALEINSTERQEPRRDRLLREDATPTSCRPDPAQRVTVVQAYKDITHEMRDGLEKIEGSDRAQGRARETREAAGRRVREGSPVDCAARCRASSTAGSTS